ncbi:MAG TPA: D-2-hydroxyacid dehydrogenase [Gemmatimonadaceae bacterium]|nr:D-2-hydroxyacid dehydrogenase [Gemmatimonadaceae bacterium]
MPRLLVVDLASSSRNWALPPEGERRIRDSAPEGWDVRVVSAPTVSDGDGNARPSDEAMEAIASAEAYVGFGIGRPLFAAARSLRWIHSAAAGVGSALFPELVRSDVLFTNSAGVHAVPIAEHVAGGVLYLIRGFDIAVDQHRAGRWDKAPFVNGGVIRELGECRVLIVGAGGLGVEIARRLACFGAQVTGIRRRPELGVPSGFERVIGPDPAELERALGEADILVLAAPQTSGTERLIGRERLARLPAGAIVVNVARGALLDEEALADAVEDGRLRGAVLDVFGEEPLPPTSRLWRSPSILLTPHVSAVSPGGFWRRELDLFIDNWRRFVRGGPLRNLVDKQAGY